MTLGDKLIDLRKKSKMTQEEVADKLNVTRQTISNWELNQTSPDADQLKGLSKIYKISIDVLIDNDIKEILTQKVSNTEKLAGLIYKILKGMLILMGIFVILSILGVVLFSSTKFNSVMQSETTINCTLNGKNYTISVISKDDNPIEVTGDDDIISLLGLDKYEHSYQVTDKLTEYFEINGGSCD